MLLNNNNINNNNINNNNINNNNINKGVSERGQTVYPVHAPTFKASYFQRKPQLTYTVAYEGTVMVELGNTLQQ